MIMLIPPSGQTADRQAYVIVTDLQSRQFSFTPVDQVIAACTAANRGDDECGGHLVSDATLELARSVLADNMGGKAPIDSSPNSDGSLSFIWEDQKRNHVFLEIGPARTVHLFYRTHELGTWEGVFASDNPAVLARLKASLLELDLGESPAITYQVNPRGEATLEFRTSAGGSGLPGSRSE